MAWFDFLRRKPKPSGAAVGAYTPEDFPCPDSFPGATRHRGGYRGWCDPDRSGDAVAFAVVVPERSAGVSGLRAIGEHLQDWQSAHDFVRRIDGIDELMRGESPETPASEFMLPMPPFTEEVALVHVAPSADNERTGASLVRALDGLPVAMIVSPAYYTQINR